MSINVTVNGNPVCIRRRVNLSDVEQIKKNERERRRRLRLEQVRQQSKELSSKLLDRAKNNAKRTLNDLENDKDSELRRMHDKKIMEIQQKYQEDMEDIGLAHTSAAAQPDVEIIMETGRRRNQLAAAERGKEACQRLKESAKQEDPVQKQQERLRQVREVENVRSSMIANLSKPKSNRPLPPKPSAPQPSPASVLPPSPAGPPQPLRSSNRPASSKRRKHKKPVPKKSSSNHQSTSVSQPSRPTQQVVVEIHQESTPLDQPLRPSKPSRHQKIHKTLEIDEIEQIDQQKPDKNQQYNPSDYQNPSPSTSSLSVSDDSSYFSDGAGSHIQDVVPPKRPVSKPQSPVKPASPGKVHMYDYNTRQRNAYNRPPGVVERVDLRDEPNAVELARTTSALQTKDSISTQSQRARAQQRGVNAVLRERVKKDYHNLIQKLDHLSREEQKLKVTQSSCARSHLDKKRRQQKKDLRQAEMNRAFEASRGDPVERIITLRAQNERDSSDSPCDSVYERSDSSPVEERPEEPTTSRNEQILDMLKKVERQKRLLLQEFGASLPDSVFNASMSRLFDNQRGGETSQEKKSTEEKVESPEIKIIKVTEPVKKPQRTETAVQTSRASSPDVTIVNDKSIQVELIDTSSKRIDRASDKTSDKTSEKTSERTSERASERASDRTAERTSEPLEYVEPIVRIIHPEVVASSDSSVPGIVIDFSRQQVKVTPTKRKTSRQKTPKSLPTSGRASPDKRPPEISKIPGSASASAPTSRVSSPQEVLEEEKPRKFKLPERKRVPIADTSTDVSFGQPSRQREQGKSYVKVRQTILKKYYNNTSDTSTSYASLPAVQPGSSYPEAVISNMTPILQMLDSSANESVVRKFRERDISPVSTPETPSPRILRIPSNVPDAERLGRLLKFDEAEAQNAEVRQRRRKSRERERPRSTPREEASHEVMEICRCTNPQCQLGLHQNVAAGKPEFASKPEAMKKYDELQNICAERIASLNALIKQVRDEKQEDFSLTGPSDDTSLMQMPAPRPRDSLQSVQKLVESIEAIHNQLARTLQESQKIITGTLNASRRVEPPKRHELTPVSLPRPQAPSPPAPPSTPRSEAKRKPKVISEETVKINLERFKPPQARKEILSHSQPSTSSARHDDLVEKLSLEILEQTKSSEKASTSRRKPDSPVNLEKMRPGNVSPTRQTPEPFVRLLADIPKAPKPFPNIPQDTGRRRPPTVSHPMAYGIEALSPPHELSTIAEFDTPDTANRSYTSARSPTGKSRRQLPLSASKQEKIIEEADVHEVATKQAPPEEERAPPEEKKESNGSAKSTDSAEVNRLVELNQSNKLITSSSSNSFSGLSGISEIISTPTSDAAIWTSSPPECVVNQLRECRMEWAITTYKRTHQASALSPSSNSDVTLTTMRRIKSPVKKNRGKSPLSGLLDFSDVSSIAIREASKSTERAVLMKARTSTPNIQNSNSSSDKPTSTSTSGISRDNSDSINLSPKKR